LGSVTTARRKGGGGGGEGEKLEAQKQDKKWKKEHKRARGRGRGKYDDTSGVVNRLLSCKQESKESMKLGMTCQQEQGEGINHPDRKKEKQKWGSRLRAEAR